MKIEFFADWKPMNIFDQKSVKHFFLNAETMIIIDPV